MMSLPKKSLGQHWLNDETTLKSIIDLAQPSSSDVILEIGPGQGSLTKQLATRVKKVIAVEIDQTLANPLKALSLANVDVVALDILKFDLSRLPPGYKVVANIPYYLTSNLIRHLAEAANPPALMVLLVQKEVAQRLTAGPGQMSLLSVSAQLYYRPTLGPVVPAELFEPAPKVDSQVIVLVRHRSALFIDLDSQKYFRLVKAGFSQRRKKLRSSIAGGLGISQGLAEQLLVKAGIDKNMRAQELSLEQWYDLYLAARKSL